ncbi:MAG: hypothetical protein KDD44_04190, partial [Bdellovibrionales bacterium]|nr:hypothetical protein [Bdellovibrionales bacterium]
MPSIITEQRVLDDDDVVTVEGIPQSEFEHTPFEQAEWEFVGERPEVLAFTPMEVEVIKSEAQRTNKLFENFAEPLSSGSDRLWHTSSGSEDVGASEDEEERVIDESLIAERVAAAFEEGRAGGDAE